MPLSHEQSARLFAEAQRLIPGGVNSPVRAFKSVGGDPLFIQRGEGPYLFDVDGNRYIDHVCSWGPLLFGHAPERVVKAISEAAAHGTSFGASTEAEVRLADAIVHLVPSIEMVRLVNSGTEAVLSAIRLARGFIGRDKVIKFEGCYHGHSDGLLARAGSGLATFDLPDSAGVPQNLTRDTLTVPYNDVDSLANAIKLHSGEIACVILEPVAGNMGVVLPKPGFLEAARELTASEGALLIFDEVITGFRLSSGGAQKLFGIPPDLTTLGKIVGGGLPLAAYGGRADIMQCVAPAGPVYQAGTLSGNPVAVAAGLAQLAMIVEGGDPLYAALAERTRTLADSLTDAAARCGVACRVNAIGSMLTVFFTDREVVDFQTAKTADTKCYGAFFRSLLESGVYFPPSQFEAAFVSAAHKDADLTYSAAAAATALGGLER